MTLINDLQMGITMPICKFKTYSILLLDDIRFPKCILRIIAFMTGQAVSRSFLPGKYGVMWMSRSTRSF